MGKGEETGLLKDVEDRDSVFSGRLHTELEAGVSGKPVSQLPQTFGKGREAGLLILCKAVGISNPDCITDKSDE
nr:hypothetical protein [uncultured Acetatifactor sp.]